MKPRFSIWVREIESDHDVELCQVEQNPEPIVKALYQKEIKLGRGRTMKKYSYVRVVDNHGR
jgi:hypothetical protein